MLETTVARGQQTSRKRGFINIAAKKQHIDRDQIFDLDQSAD
jgi:hypothetical protein